MNRPILLSVILVFAILLISCKTTSEVPTLSLDNLETHYSVLADTTYKGRPAIHLHNTSDREKSDRAVAFIKDVVLANCEIEVDIASERFTGIVFRGQDGDHFDKVYFRPFNSGTEKHLNTVQYASPGTPGAHWKELREKFPGKYEAGADIPVWEWFHARIVVKEQRAEVYVNNEKEPVLVVEELLSGQNAGAIGIWGWNCYFSNYQYRSL